MLFVNQLRIEPDQEVVRKHNNSFSLCATIPSTRFDVDCWSFASVVAAVDGIPAIDDVDDALLSTLAVALVTSVAKSRGTGIAVADGEANNRIRSNLCDRPRVAKRIRVSKQKQRVEI